MISKFNDDILMCFLLMTINIMRYLLHMVNSKAKALTHDIFCEGEGYKFSFQNISYMGKALTLKPPLPSFHYQ